MTNDKWLSSVVLAASVFLGGIEARGQGVFLTTGVGQALTSRSFALNASAGSLQPVLSFEIGFATDEVFAPSQFFDSITVSVAGGAERVFATLLTSDASGALWAPVTAGGAAVSPDSINRAARPYPDAAGTYRSEQAFSVSWPVPAQFRGGSFEVTFDLFDNLDANGSQAFFTVPVIVPEPSVVTILAVSSFLLFGWLRRGRR